MSEDVIAAASVLACFGLWSILGRNFRIKVVTTTATTTEASEASFNQEIYLT